MEFKEMESRIRGAARFLDVDINERQMENLQECIKAFNPKYPTDTISLVDATSAVFNSASLPGAVEKEILLRHLNGGDFNSGDGRWKISARGEVTYCFSPKRSGGYYEVLFGDLSFPLEVVVNRWADMDDLKNHNDFCPSLLSEEDSEYSDDCYCESFVEQVFEGNFKDDEELRNPEKGLSAFLLHAHYEDGTWG